MKTVIGIIGGSGLYDLGSDTKVLGEERITTPYGDPSDTITRVAVGESEALFLPRHGKTHHLSPSEVNYRANIYALKSLGASWCIAVSAVGSLREEIKPGDIVVPNQFIDRTVNRNGSFFGEGLVAHVSLADPYCAILRQILYTNAREIVKTHERATYICIEGPQFSTRAESHMYRSWGADIIGMTNLPEVRLAREAELAYATLALATDYDCWKENEQHVEAVSVIQVMKKNSENARQILKRVIPELANRTPDRSTSQALDQAIFTPLSNVPAATLNRLDPILKRYSSR